MAAQFTAGILHRQEGNLKLGSWQMVLWQPRWVYATTEGLCYQKITADERPIGKEKKVLYTDILKIDELEYGEFQLEVAKRMYTFKCATDTKCQVCVHVPRAGATGVCPCVATSARAALRSSPSKLGPIGAGFCAQFTPAAGAKSTGAGCW